MEELQAAVLVSLDATADASLRERALTYCQNVRASPDGWVFALQSLSLSMRPEAAFWCLQVVQEVISDPARYPRAMSPNQISGLRSTLLSYLSQIVFPERFVNNAVNSTFPSFLYNKLAQLVVAVIAADYPHAWPEGFRECVLNFVTSSANSSVEPGVTFSSVAMFFRLLRALDEDVTSVRAAQVSEIRRAVSVRVKDGLREDCIVKIIDVCTDLLREPKFACHAFDIFARYVEWVDISLIVRERILTPMYEAITSPKACQWRGAAAAALRALVQKRMDVPSKAQLLRSLNMDKLLFAIRADVIVANDDGSVDSELNLQGGQVEVAGLVNTVAITALEIMKAVWKNDGKGNVGSDGRAIDGNVAEYVGALAQAALPVALQFLDENTEDGTGAQTLECVTTYVNVYGQAGRADGGNASEESVSVICAILKVVEERGRFASDMDPTDENSEKGRAFCELKKVLVKKVFSSVARFFPTLSVHFVRNLYTKARESGDIARLELALSMVMGLSAAGGDCTEVNDMYSYVISTPPQCLDFGGVDGSGGSDAVTLVQTRQLELVSKRYFEVVGRCSKMLLGEADGRLLSGVLNVIFDTRGLGHLTSESVRSHATIALVKIAKPLRGVMSLAHVEAVVRAAHSHLLPVEEDIETQRWKNQMVMFETVGYLLGTDVKGNGSVQLVYGMLQAIVNGLESRAGGMGCVSYVAAAGYLSKGFGGDCKVMGVNVEGERKGEGKEGNGAPKNGGSGGSSGNGGGVCNAMMDVWIGCIDAVVKVSSASLRGGDEPWLSEMRLKLIFFLHRMVDTVGKRVIPYLENIGEELLKWGQSAAELREVISLMSQCAIKFGMQFEIVAVKVDGVMVQQVDRLSFSIDPTSLMTVSETDREALDVMRAFLYWINAIIGSGLIDSLMVHRGQHRVLSTVMNCLVRHAVSEHMDVRAAAAVMRMAWLTLGRMIERWRNEAAHSDKKSFLREFMLPAVLQCMLESGVKSVLFRGGDFSSGQTVSVVTDIVKVQRLCVMEFGEAFTNGLYKLIAHAITQQDWLLYVQQLGSIATPQHASNVGSCVPAWTAIIQRVRSTPAAS